MAWGIPWLLAGVRRFAVDLPSLAWGRNPFTTLPEKGVGFFYLPLAKGNMARFEPGCPGDGVRFVYLIPVLPLWFL